MTESQATYEDETTLPLAAMIDGPNKLIAEIEENLEAINEALYGPPDPSPEELESPPQAGFVNQWSSFTRRLNRAQHKLHELRGRIVA